MGILFVTSDSKIYWSSSSSSSLTNEIGTIILLQSRKKSFGHSFSLYSRDNIRMQAGRKWNKRFDVRPQ